MTDNSTTTEHRRDLDPTSGIILDTIKKMLGLEYDYEHFDVDIVVYINTAFMTLNQLGVGPKNIFAINDYTARWEEFLDGDINFEAIKQYIYLKVRTLFDPPSSSYVLDAMERQIDELEWRLKLQTEREEEE